ncbi:MAG: rhodanese-like domain-containing protein [Phycisphaerales bacterium]|nr:rhodanese-like domain-containing protein [Phycisphaerales bacterium]
MSASPTPNNPVVDVAPRMLADWLAHGQADLVDVREDFEHAAERILPSENAALSAFDAQRVRERHGDRRVVFYCRTGRRSADAARRFRASDEPVFHLAGGIEGWKSAGLTVERAPGAPRIDVLRQTHMSIGTLVLSGTLLGAFVSPWFLIVSGFMGAGLIFAGASGTCGMAMLIGKMPWNRPPAQGPCGPGGAACGK